MWSRKMGSSDRSKRRIQLWKKAMFHFLLCFVMGFFTGFAPTNTNSVFSKHVGGSNQSTESPEFSPEPPETLHHDTQVGVINRSLIAEVPANVPTSTTNDSIPTPRVEEEHEDEDLSELVPRKQLIIITTTKSNDAIQGAYLRRMANTLSLVAPPLVWIVVEAHSDSTEMSEILRRTSVMYRHLVYKENFTDVEAEIDHQRNVALNHIEHHRLDGIVHFADVYNFYDMEFFQQIREIEYLLGEIPNKAFIALLTWHPTWVFGTWPMAQVSANRKRVVVEGPICDSSQVIGWHLRDSNTQTNIGSALHISSFAFNSSILWDPERWGRPSSVQDTSQNSVKIVQQLVVEEETKLKGLPQEDCSKIMLWHLHIPIHSRQLSVSSSDDQPR